MPPGIVWLGSRSNVVRKPQRRVEGAGTMRWSAIMSEDKRLRVHPEQRFDHPELQFDLNDVAAKLQAEPLGNRRHRQETIYRHGPLTVALFLFEAGASLTEHEAKGTITVQVLKGRLKMSADGQVHDLPAG